MTNFKTGNTVKSLDGSNHYEITKVQGGCYRMLCIKFEQQESLSCDVTCYSYGSELWLSSENDHTLELVN